MLACYLPTGTTVLGHSCASDFDTFSLHSTTLKKLQDIGFSHCWSISKEECKTLGQGYDA